MLVVEAINLPPLRSKAFISASDLDLIWMLHVCIAFRLLNNMNYSHDDTDRGLRVAVHVNGTIIMVCFAIGLLPRSQ